MSANTSIEWTDKTWNPTRGCSVVSPGCVNCYAMKQAHRFSGGWAAGLTKSTKAGPQWTGVVRTVEDALLEPLSWKKPQRVFVNSMSDLFHEDVPDAFVDQVFATMAAGNRHTYQILTKRAERMRRYISDPALEERIHWASLDRFGHTEDFDSQVDSWVYGRWPLPNVWLGVSVEDQQRADERIPLLLQTPAAIRFLSCEPLIGPVDLKEFFDNGHESNGPAGWVPGPIPDWVIVGGESGPHSRPFDIAWARSIVQQCKAANVACFVKQLGAEPFDWDSSEPTGRFRTNPETGRRQMELRARRLCRDRKGGDPCEWPEDVRIRQFPEVRG